MYKIDERMLSYLKPCAEQHILQYGNDTYYCGGSKYLSKCNLDSRVENVKKWVEKNGGKFEIKSNWFGLKDAYVCVVQIIFPTYGKRNMKEIMSTLFFK